MYLSVWEVTKIFETHDLNVKKEAENYVHNWKLFFNKENILFIKVYLQTRSAVELYNTEWPDLG